ncbi:hypothetical protein [Persephonella sp.]
MIIEGIDLASGNKILADINPLKKSVSVIQKGKPVKKIYGFPVKKTLLRIYEFPFKNREKLHKAVISHLKYDLPVALDELEYSYITRAEGDTTKIFCIAVRKSDLKGFDGKSSVDSEIFALIRLLRFNGITDCTLIHFGPDYIFVMKIKDSFPQFVRTILKEEIEIYTEENTYLSGFIPDDYRSGDINLLNNPTGDTKMNVAFGLVLRALDDFGVDLLHRDRGGLISVLLKGAVYLFIAFILLNGALFGVYYFKEKELKIVKEKEKEIFIKYFGDGTPVYDPLTQAKGLVSIKGKGSVSEEDAVDLLNEIGRAKKESGIKEIYKINISGTMFTVYGKADSITKVEKFKNLLSRKYTTTIEETVNTPAGDIRFVVKGKKE